MTTMIVLITGCSEGGAGAALAKEFHSRGHRVFATARNVLGLASLEALGIETLPLDVTGQISRDTAAATISKLTGGILHILINNAAVYSLMPLADTNLEDARQVFEANVFGVLAVTQAFLPLLINAAGTGLVANVSSISAGLCPPWQGIYSASKAALTAIGHTMRLEFAPLGVRVTTIISGGVDTPLKRQAAFVPAGSYYSSLANSIELNGTSSDYTPMSPTEYAKLVANDLLKPHPRPLLWRGAFASVAWGLSWLGWVGMMDNGQRTRSGLSTIIR
ncbi:short-chain dehydrogenase/reductase [Microdochium trichocladiopsis]|uniref:Short-chain dehydrogenase/reductase n=1 Tax=Microdochium trichocladiopsis TaxID=1682393 RepID=A0A9P8XRE6_9PEZI|nr:short-chain dehydrogenase/reductase [Microdochium trichocladiopsis]KAH7012736.1 short-chain dehydrogenase/reductase [Microdochium trichocladiopsis]